MSAQLYQFFIDKCQLVRCTDTAVRYSDLLSERITAPEGHSDKLQFLRQSSQLLAVRNMCVTWIVERRAGVIISCTISWGDASVVGITTRKHHCHVVEAARHGNKREKDCNKTKT